MVTSKIPSRLISAVTTRAATSSGVPNSLSDIILTGSTVMPYWYLLTVSDMKLTSSRWVFTGFEPSFIEEGIVISCFNSLLFNTVCFRVKTNGASVVVVVVSSPLLSAASAWFGFPISAASPNNKLHAAVDSTDRREEGDDNGAWAVSTSGDSEEEDGNDGVVGGVDVVWDDQQFIP